MGGLRGENEEIKIFFLMGGERLLECANYVFLQSYTKWFVCNALEMFSQILFATQTMFLNDFLLIYAKKLLFPELCKQRSFKKEIFVFGEFEGGTPQCPGLPLNVWR